MEALSQKSRKALALFLSLVMVTSICIPTAAWGAAEPTEPKADPVEVATADELASAVAAGGAIVLTGDVVLPGSIALAAGIQVELDLAGYSVSIEAGKKANTFANSGNFTIKDSVGGGAILGLNAIYNAGQLILQGGTLEGTNAGIFVGSGSVSINGGTVRCSGDKNNAIYLSNGSVEVTDGVIEASSNGSAVKGIGGSLRLSGGKFKPGANLIAISGVNIAFGEGMDFPPEPNADGYYEVGAYGSAAKINGVAYESLSAALAAKAPGENVELQRDVLLPEPISFNKSCTLICGDHTLKAPFLDSRLELLADVTIKNGTLESADDSIRVKDPAQVVLDGMGVVSGNRAVYASGGSVHIKSGSYKTTAQGVYALSVGNSAAKFTIDSATVTNGSGTEPFLVMTNKSGEEEAAFTLNGEKEWIGQTCNVYSTENMVQVPDGTKYASIDEALAAGQTELALTRTVVSADAVTIPAGTSLTLHLGANRYGGDIVNNGSLTLDADGLKGGVKGSITNSGSLVVNGGSYTTDVSSFVGERYVAVHRDGMYDVTEAVARIGNIKYATLADAIAAASTTGNESTLIVLMRDSKNTDEVDIENRFLTLDLAGFTLQGVPVGSEGTKTAGLRVQQGSVVTVKNGTLDTPKGDQSYYPVNNQGTLTLQNVKVTGESINALVRNSGNLTMADCTVKNDNAIEPGDGSGHDGSFGLLCQYYEYANAGTMTTKISGSDISGGYGGIKVIGGPDSDHVVNVEISGDAVTGGPAGALVAENGSQGNPAKIALTGGTYSSDVAEWCAVGYASRANGAGGYDVVSDPAAERNGVRYATLKGAIADMESGDTITLLRDETISGYTFLPHGGVIDLNGYTLTGKDNGKNCLFYQRAATFGDDETLVVRNGKMTSKLARFFFFDRGEVTFEKLELIGGDSAVKSGLGLRGVCVYGGSLTVDSDSSVTVADGEVAYGLDVQNSGSVIIAGRVTVHASEGIAVTGNGDKADGTIIVAKDGATIDGGSSLGIYHPQAGVLVIESGASVIGSTGIEMRAGNLEVQEGAVVRGTGAFSAEPNDSGGTANGVGIAVAQHTMKKDIDVTVLGGTISGEYALYEANPQNNSSEDIARVHIAVSGGSFTGTKAAVRSEDVRDFVTGGSFSGILDKAYYDEDVYEQLEPDTTGLGKIVPRSYALSYDLAGGALPEGASNPETYTWFNDEITLTNPTKDGFDFMGWKEGATDPKLEVKIPAHSIGDRSFTATWKERTDTPYEVVHAFQNVEGDGYTNDDNLTQHLKGTTNADTAVEALEVAGFTAQPVAQKAIAPDGTTVVEVRYDRNVHHVSYEYRGDVPAGASTLPEKQACRYGAAVSVAPAATAPGYDFVGWDSSDELVMGDADVVLYGSFVARGDTAYKVDHYQQNLDGTYRLADTDELAGKTDSEAVAALKNYIGFSWNEGAPETQVSGSIAGDGSLVLKLYYDRASYRLAYAYQGDVPVSAPAVPREQTFRFGEVVTLAQAPSMTGYDFSGWSCEDGFAMPAENVMVTGSWSPRTDAGYTVRYMLDGTEKQLLDGKVVDGCTFGAVYTEEAPAITGYSVKGSSIQQVTIDAYDKTVVFSYTADAARIVFESNGGSAVEALEGVTNQVVVDRALPVPTRVGYAFAGWHDNKALGGQSIAQLPETFPVGTTTFWAKWNAVPLPEIAPNIQVELPTPVEGADVSSAVAEKAVAAVARHAKDALDAIGNGEVPKGMNEDDANRIAKALEGAPEDRTTVIVTVKADPRDEGEVADHEKGAIEGVSAPGEKAAVFLDLSVTMTVKVESEDGEKVVEDVPLSEVSEPMLFEVHVDPALIAGKSVRVAHVHEGATEIIVPESVDYEQGIVTFYASRFSTYALLTAEEVEVRFESNGGSAVASQTVTFGEKVQKPQDPTRTGYVFAGWFTDEGLTSAYEFDQPVTAPLTLFATWTKNGSGGSIEPGGDTPSGDKPGANDTKPTNPAKPGGTDSGKDGSHKDAATKASSLKATGDNPLASTAALALGGCLAALLAFAASSVRRTRRSS